MAKKTKIKPPVELVTVAEYARRRDNMRRATIHANIKNGKIEAILMGHGKATFIDWNRYKDFKFRSYSFRNRIED